MIHKRTEFRFSWQKNCWLWRSTEKYESVKRLSRYMLCIKFGKLELTEIYVKLSQKKIKSVEVHWAESIGM